jgi:hypothetical protein
MVDATSSTAGTSKGNVALGLGVAAIVANVLGFFIAGENDENGWIWMVMGALALGAVIVGLMDGRGKPAGRALIGTVLGAVVLIEFLLFATGILS